MKRLMAVTAVLGLFLGLLAAPALAQRPDDRPPSPRPADPPGQPADTPRAPYPPPPGHEVRPNITIANPGATINIEGRNWGPGTVIDITHENNQQNSLASGQADESGAFSLAVTIPEEASDGHFGLVVSGTSADGLTETRNVALTVDKAFTGAGVSAAAPTFWTIGNTALLALVLLGFGFLLLGPVRKRALAARATA